LHDSSVPCINDPVALDFGEQASITVKQECTMKRQVHCRNEMIQEEEQKVKAVHMVFNMKFYRV
jgi:hypothetical protein